MLQVGKLDEVELKIARIKELNGLNKIEVSLDLLFKDKEIDEHPLKIHEKDVEKAIMKVFKSNLFVNLHHMIPLKVKVNERDVILKVTVDSIESLKEGTSQTYGLLEE
mmetsp:Transcript_20355/g.19335  ORF Transcript_20355/g.19335 Transcript_20355/m.19335 type:complete len:108 (+) Transcript_20355:213-536(+)